PAPSLGKGEGSACAMCACFQQRVFPKHSPVFHEEGLATEDSGAPGAGAQFVARRSTNSAGLASADGCTPSGVLLGSVVDRGFRRLNPRLVKLNPPGSE